MTALHFASSKGNIEAVNLLIPKVGINARAKEGTTILQIACEEGQVEMVKWLIARDDIDINLPNEKGETAFHFACRGQPEVMQLLIASGNLDINAKDNHGITAFAYAFHEHKIQFPDVFRLATQIGETYNVNSAKLLTVDKRVIQTLSYSLYEDA
mmetsp:Transcript_89722/g.134474  ORF Transcript_89722/g.134474 Transcript_89722/m.134474 type:complete len:155 (-) Transcript_89722:73-537(-)